MFGLIILLSVIFITIGGGLGGWYILVESEGDAMDAADEYGDTMLNWAGDFVLLMFLLGLIYFIIRVTKRMNQ